MNLAAENLLVTKNLNLFVKNESTAVVNIDVNIKYSELKKLTLMVRKKFTSSIILADFSEFQDENFQKQSEKIQLVTEKLKNGFLIVFRSGVSFQRDKARFLTKTIILTGTQNVLFLLKLQQVNNNGR
jgi:hypothetical protein